ncbi:ABC transporter ATP-binding protein [Pararhizobium mangrovi]|uniref:ABC transporter ATP-binding protein n=1 Tax=Pararhizobium mangrovi TaxID=2590452 RepID=A0A506UD76_9HYPH|nr:ABC transporter ATP-binding protein [Pararhizobium mangrovi]TPW30619.1 ABC transporter ATP-binding protein [Pararhizobium mangrovi]
MSFLVVEGLSLSFGGVRAVDDVSFTLAKGELLALIGPNGAGKSTCFNMLYGVSRPDSGSVKLDGNELVGLKPRQIWRLGVGRTFQITATFTSMTVCENVQMALLSHANRTFGIFRRAHDAYRDQAMDLLDIIGMRGQADRPTNVLAYGDLKRLELAIALANEPKLLLMDEPTAGMAQPERRSLMKLTADLVRDRGTSVLFTEHDMDVVFEHSHRLLVLNRGRVLAEGSVAEVRADPKVREIYLGGGSTYASMETNHA